jgi:hypothetical protein
MYLPNDGNIAHLCITRKIHHIVLESFGIFRPTKHHVADHINGIRNDNRLVNLRWVTTADNTRHAIEDRFGGTTWMAGNSYGSLNGGPNHYRASLTEAQVREILAALLSGVSQKQLSEKYGVRRTTISRIKTGARWSCVTNIAGGNKQ